MTFAGDQLFTSIPVFTQDDYEGVWNVAAFLLAFVCCVFQVNVAHIFNTQLLRNETHKLSLTCDPFAVPPVPVPFASEETQVLHSVGCDRLIQRLPAWLEKCVAAYLPHFCRLPLHPPHPHPQTPRHNHGLWSLRSTGQCAALLPVLCISQVRKRNEKDAMWVFFIHLPKFCVIIVNIFLYTRCNCTLYTLFQRL